MKVLKRGGDWRRVKCPHCKSKLKIDASDVIVTEEWGDVDGSDGMSTRTYVVCAVCDEKFHVYVPHSTVSARKELEKRRDHDL